MKLLIDSLNRLDVSAVPIVLFVDRNGVIRQRNPKPSDINSFLQQQFPDSVESNRIELPAIGGDRHALNEEWDPAIARYSKHLRDNPNDSRAMFRLGVSYRARFDDATTPNANDFVKSIHWWRAALAANPNQYIWRRRLQQYGPILSKPYPFYDWVETARAEIRRRGDMPVELITMPKGAELVGPATESKSETPSGSGAEPDPSGLVSRDTGGEVLIREAVIPSTEKKRTARIHLMMNPDPSSDYQWNNEADPVRIWLSDETFDIPRRAIEVEHVVDTATSSELRSAEFEVSWDPSIEKRVASGSAPRLSGYAVYHLCHKKSGVCEFRRQDFEIDVFDTKTGQP